MGIGNLCAQPRCHKRGPVLSLGHVAPPKPPQLAISETKETKETKETNRRFSYRNLYPRPY